MNRILCALAAALLAVPGAIAQCVPPAIVMQPASLTVGGCCPCAGFSVTATGTPPLTYQWEKNGLPIPGATTAAYTNCDLTLADGGTVYRVVVFNACGLVGSDQAVLTVTPDVTPPRLVGAEAWCRSNKLTLVFDECLDPETAGDVSTYALDGGATVVLAAQLQSDRKTVCLLLDLPFAALATHSIAIAGMRDRCGNQADVIDLAFAVRCDDCLELGNETLECVPGAAGHYTWRFTLRNLSTNAIQYVYLVPATNCFTLSPPVTILTTPLGPGQSTPLSATLNLGTNCGSNLCLRVSMHDPAFVLCCAALHCLALPDLIPAPRLQISHAPPNVILTWPGCGVLQCTTNLGTGWVDVPNATSPYVVRTDGARKFYRLRL